jgi:hypothetical protein
MVLLAFEVVVDSDGDGDADDDNERGKRGDWHSNNGRGDVEGVEGDHDRDGVVDAVKVGKEIILEAEGFVINGKVEVRHVAEGDDVEQKLEFEIEDGAPDTVYTLRIYFGDVPVELGPVTSDADGEFEVKFKTGADEPGFVIEDFLAMDMDVTHITAVEILLDGEVVLGGDF